jgi:hypothetical protein
MLNDIVKWAALVATIGGAICTSMNIYPVNIYLCNLGSILYLTWAIRIRDVNLILVNAGLLVIYGTGFLYSLK